MKEKMKKRTITNCKLHCGVLEVSFAGFSFRSSVSFGQERSSKSAPTTCTNRYLQVQRKKMQKLIHQ